MLNKYKQLIEKIGSFLQRDDITLRNKFATELLQSEKDEIIFEQTIKELYKTKAKSKTITLNGREWIVSLGNK